MGSLAHFYLEGLAKLHGLKHFVETGTAQGDGLALAAQVKEFRTLHSVEIVPELVAAARARFLSDKRIHVWEGDSRSVMPMLLRDLPAEPCLWWLDAHFPGAHSGAEYTAEADAAKRLPLADEIAAIRAARAGIRDVLLLDDARIYQPGPYACGDLPPDWPPLEGVERSLDFVRKAYGATHGVVVDFSDQGYVMVVPRAHGPVARQ
jgi:hypothetical protein